MSNTVSPPQKDKPLQEEPAKKNGQLGALEEDDEFEEFEAEGNKKRRRKKVFTKQTIEWEDKDEENTDDNLWEDNWDDDDIEPDFATVLQNESRVEPEPMNL
ncbi:hypothetical protein BDF21DRAFT_415527 [Thamnidium elegans]|uniref:26S proteasome complex subunit SEM1 n=1 Tax=Thamnidium elegans TaxID=101142 RepID=A0A8H7SU04_9FUNG|nr:hypothetical protein INT48_002887 [Thamnidium elegans]KAI8085581.1 hypothetical protein BDF21DRAFT_415527 [Thamnidium elegans]